MSFKKSRVAFVVLLLISALHAEAGKSRRSPVDRLSKEVMMTFEGQVDVTAAEARSAPAVRERIEEQLRFLFGWMTESAVPGAPKGDHQITPLAISRGGSGARILYRYVGSAVVRQDQSSFYELVLPLDPGNVYLDSLRAGINACSHPDWRNPGDFWFAWEPRRRGCPLRDGENLLVVKARLSRIPQPKTTYPEYERLADAAGRIRIDFLMGMDGPWHARDPNRSRDLNALNFLRVRKGLLAAGWQSRRATPAEIRGAVGPNIPFDRLPYIEDLAKTVVQEKTGRVFHLFIRFFYGNTEMEDGSAAFHWFLKDALEKAAVVVYDGHSGIGEYLDLPTIEKKHGFRIQPPKDRYQIYFFNSCNSYAHYNTMFFGRKASPQDPQGTRNLDIITAGLGTYFHSGHESNLAFIGALEAWAAGHSRLSYQQLTPRMDTGNLLGINGDDDNPRR